MTNWTSRHASAILPVIFVAGLFAQRGQPTLSRWSDPELRTAAITMVRENRCGLGQPDPTDLRQCPDYSVTISGDSVVTYEGRSGVRTIGRRTHRARVDEVRQLLSEFERAGFFVLQDRYEAVLVNDEIQMIDHAAATTVGLSIGGKTKTVFSFYGAPAIVGHLERRIDEVSDSRRYTGRVVEPPREAAVYAAVLALAFHAVPASRMAVRETSVPMPPIADASTRDVTRQFDELPEELRRRARTPTPISLFIANLLPPTVRTVSTREIQRLIPRGSSAGWEEFVRQHGAGWIALSEVVFTNGDLDALVFVQAECGALCGESSYIWLQRTTTLSPWAVVHRIVRSFALSVKAGTTARALSISVRGTRYEARGTPR